MEMFDYDNVILYKCDSYELNLFVFDWKLTVLILNSTAAF